MCPRPRTPYAAAQLQPIHALRLRRPERLAFNSCGRHEYSRCTRQTDRRQTSSNAHHRLMPPIGRGQNDVVVSEFCCQRVYKLLFLSRDAMRKRGLCCRLVSVRPSVRHIRVLYPDVQRYRQTSFSAG